MNRDCEYETWIPDYIEGTLDDALTHAFENHMADCAVCLDTATLLTALSRQQEESDLDPVPPTLTLSALASIRARAKGDHTRLMRMALRAQAMVHLALASFRILLEGPWQLSLARGPERGMDGELVSVMKRFKGTAVEIEIEKTGLKTALIRIQLLNPSVQWRGTRVTLKRGRREIGSYPLNEGYVLIEDIDFGRYNLLFSRNGAEMGRYHFEIRETPHE